MRDLDVLILAVGATRRKAVVADSTRVIAEGGRATVLIDKADAWRQETLAPGVRILRAELDGPIRVEQLMLVRAPRRLFRLIAHGPLSRFAQRAGGAYQRRIADRVHRRIFLPLYRRVWGEVGLRPLTRFIRHRGHVDLLVVSDPASIPLAAQFVDRYVADAANPMNIAYNLDHVMPTDRGGTAG
jgi:hypothetical protein